LHSSGLVFLFEPTLSLDHERIVLDVYFHVLGLEAGQFSVDVVLAFALRDLNGGGPSGAIGASALEAYLLEDAVHLLAHSSEKREWVAAQEFMREPGGIISAPLQETGSGRAACDVFPLGGLRLLLAGLYREGLLIGLRWLRWHMR
jgi:hypothetical protein